LDLIFKTDGEKKANRLRLAFRVMVELATIERFVENLKFIGFKLSYL